MYLALSIELQLFTTQHIAESGHIFIHNLMPESMPTFKPTRLLMHMSEEEDADAVIEFKVKDLDSRWRPTARLSG